jgi:hypothetical protein
MPARARKLAAEPEPLPARRPKVFHASVLVTRLEEWFVEADSAEEARALFAAGEGHRAAQGERFNIEIERLLESAK